MNEKTVRNTAFVLLGVGGLLLKGIYAGPLEAAVHSWAGNVSVSFAVYFLGLIALGRRRHARLFAALLALAAVTAFEATDGFGVMTNVYDPLDYLANAVGIGLAIAVDLLTDRPRKAHGSGAAKAGRPPDARGRA
jgi:peptidoglycan/LPS O-acetylase OafA/YrhL